MARAKPRIKNGTHLAKALELPVKEGRYRDDGYFYQRPTAYPCAFFDKYGFAIVESEVKLREIASVGRRVNFRRPIARQNGYAVVKNWEEWPRKEREYRVNVAAVSVYEKLLADLTDDEKKELIQRLRLSTPS